MYAFLWGAVLYVLPYAAIALVCNVSNWVKFTLYLSILSSLAAPCQAELVDSLIMVKEYNEVFKMKGHPIVVNQAQVVVAAEDRLRTLLHMDSSAPIDLSHVRNMSQSGLVQILFYAVAGSYVTVPHSHCPVLMDADTGGLEAVLEHTDNEGVLVGMCVTLLCILGVMVLKHHSTDPPLH